MSEVPSRRLSFPSHVSFCVFPPRHSVGKIRVRCHRRWGRASSCARPGISAECSLRTFPGNGEHHTPVRHTPAPERQSLTRGHLVTGPFLEPTLRLLSGRAGGRDLCCRRWARTSASIFCTVSHLSCLFLPSVTSAVFEHLFFHINDKCLSNFY